MDSNIIVIAFSSAFPFPADSPTTVYGVAKPTVPHRVSSVGVVVYISQTRR